MGTIFQKLHTRHHENSSLFFHRNFHLNLLRCRCRNTKSQQLHWQSSTNNYKNKTLERLVTKLREGEIIGSGATLQLCDKGCSVTLEATKLL